MDMGDMGSDILVNAEDPSHPANEELVPEISSTTLKYQIIDNAQNGGIGAIRFADNPFFLVRNGDIPPMFFYGALEDVVNENCMQPSKCRPGEASRRSKKKQKLKEICRDNFFDDATFGNMQGDYLSSLFALMSYVIQPMTSLPNVVPESMRNEFSSTVDKLMCTITNAHYRLLGETVLYVPTEVLSFPIDIVSRDRKAFSRLEAVMIHWIRQLMELLNNQTLNDAEDDLGPGPLDEIKYWKARVKGLAALVSQLKSKSVRTVQQIMTIMKSPFVSTFDNISMDVLGANAEAISNLYYLETLLLEPCKKLHESTITEIPEQLQNILWLIRVIWLNSPYYNTRDRLNSILRKLSNELIAHCLKAMSFNNIFEGKLDDEETVIKECLNCLTFWKDKYMEAEKMHSMNSYLAWLMEYDHIMSHVNILIYRLQDLLEICACQRLWAKILEPMQAYQHVEIIYCPELVKVMRGVQTNLNEDLADIKAARSKVFDLNNPEWQNCMVKFRQMIREIEMTFQRTLHKLNTVN